MRHGAAYAAPLTEHLDEVTEFLVNTDAMVQTWYDAKHDVLPAAAQANRARMPVMMLRLTDRVMRLDGSLAGASHGPVLNIPSMSAEECTAHRRTGLCRNGDLVCATNAVAWPRARARARGQVHCSTCLIEGEWPWSREPRNRLRRRR